MLPLHVFSESDPFLLGRRAVDIALRNDAHSIVLLAQRYHAVYDPKRRRGERLGLVLILVAGGLWFTGTWLVGASAIFMGVTGLPLVMGMIFSVRGAIWRHRQREMKSMMRLALLIRGVLEDRDQPLVTF